MLHLQKYMNQSVQVTDNQIELITARNQHFHFNLHHIKTIHFPYQNHK